MSRLIEVGPGRFAHATGALWLAEPETALIADTHLGFGWAQRRRGELGPVHDTRSEPKLRLLIEELRPRRIVVLGDFVHAPRPGAAERQAIESTIEWLRKSSELVLVRGNHDRAFWRDFKLRMLEEWESGALVARHGDRLTEPLPVGSHLVVGHLHPVLNFRDAAGARHKVRVFLTNSRATVLPAFSPYASGFEINDGLPYELRALFGDEPVAAVGVTGTGIGRKIRLVNP